VGSGSGSGYPTGKPFTAFIDLPFRAALQSQLGAVVRTGKARSLGCGVLAADGTAEREVTVCPARVRGESAQLVLQFCRGQLRDDVTMLALRAGEPPAA
jgi:hypothetical protein